MYSIETTNKFEKDLKICQKRGLDMAEIQTAIMYLESDGQVPEKYKPHKLNSNYAGFWECHIKPNWLLIYDIQDTIKLITLTRTGTHSDLF